MSCNHAAVIRRPCLIAASASLLNSIAALGSALSWPAAVGRGLGEDEDIGFDAFPGLRLVC